MHRVYVHEDGQVFTLASVYATRQPLPECPDKYVVFETSQSPSYERVCLMLQDGRLLCDVGPDHLHDDGDELAWDDLTRALHPRRL